MTSGVTEPIALEKVMSGVTELLEGGDRDKVWLALGSDPALASRLGENGVGLRKRWVQGVQGSSPSWPH